MRFNRLLTASQALISLLIISCASMPPLPDDKTNDFKLNGFLDDNHFQVTASAKPDPSIKGLVAQRDSSLIKARNLLQQKTVDSLVNHRLNLYILSKGMHYEQQLSNADTIKAHLRDKVFEYISYGSFTEEYFDKDNSAQVVFRIVKKNLKNEIESISISEKPGPEKSNQTEGKSNEANN